jgi:diazepam-binding inhibitor (GABA receptor modulator, acyl-CoA-binding protein)
MSDLKARFDQAARDVKELDARPDNTTLLQLYALYKQATVGDANGKRPGMLDLVGRAKYDAWERLKGNTADQAMEQYIAVVQKMLDR